MRYDTIIIGAGLSGLAAGIRLAHFEKRVAVLERHYTIGGLNSFYRLRKRDHDVGLHAVTNFAEPGTKKGPLSKLLRQLRLRWDDFALVPQNGSDIVFPGTKLHFNNDLEFFCEQVAQSFPKQKDNFRQLVRIIDEHDELHLTTETQSARMLLNKIIPDPLLIDMLFCPLMFYGSPTPDDMDFSQFCIMFKALFHQGFGRPYKGVRLIMKNIVKQFRGSGGELKLRSGVQRILSNNGRATRVELESGEVLEADNVLSSAGALETLALCEDVPSQLTESVEPGELSFVETIFSLDKQPAELGHDTTIIFYNDSEEFRYRSPAAPCDVASGIICSPNNFRYESDQVEEGRIRITALANPGFWMNLPDNEYYAAKDEWCDQILKSALRFMPDFRAHIVDTDMFTPRTIKKFTGHLNAAVYGAATKFRDGRTHLENLFLCGTDQGFLGIIGAMLSGITIANLHLMK